MNIGIVCYPTFGGSGVLATELGKALADKGHNIHFITYQQPVRLTGFSANIFYHEVHVPTYPLFDFPPYETALASTMVDVIRNNKLNLLHVHYAIPHASAAYMAKMILKNEGINIPVITTLHGTDITLVGKDKTYSPVVAFSINQSDAITAVSDNLREETYNTFFIEKKIEVIHNFVDVERFNRKPIDAFQKVIAPNGERIVVHASNFRKIKRVQDVVKIFQQIVKQVPAKLLLVGDGPERPMVEELARELGIVSEIKFLGKQQDMEEIFAVTDLFLLPSEYESFGLAALEAMASGTAVVCSNAGGLPEIIEQGVCGYMANVGDVQAMAEFSLDILRDENRMAQFQAAAQLQAQRFDIRNIIPIYERLYEKVVSS
jgi:N-acetyl-alpha-D-glucosaminyl L-malate synthase BshA